MPENVTRGFGRPASPSAPATSTPSAPSASAAGSGATAAGASSERRSTGFGPALAAAAAAGAPTGTIGADPLTLLVSPMSERSVLCAVLTAGRETLASNVSAILAAADFANPAHEALFRVWRQLFEAGNDTDVAAILDGARKKNEFLGGEDYVVGLATDLTLQAASDGAIAGAANRIKELSVLRHMHVNLLAITTKIASGSFDVNQISTMIEDEAGNARGLLKSSRAGFEHIARFADSVLAAVDKKLDGEEIASAAPTPFSGLTRRLQGGFMDEDLIILAGRPSMGKTAVLVNIMDAAAAAGYTVGLWSMEMRGAAITKRGIQKRGRVPGSAFYDVNEMTQNLDRIMEGAQQIAGLPIYIDESPTISLAEVRARGRELKAKNPKLVLALDYLQLVQAGQNTKPGTPMQQVVSEISRGLKVLARELKCPVIALSQLSRAVETRSNKRPMLSDLRESGQIEQDADVIMFIYRDEYYNTDTKEPGVTELIVAKQREGETGTVKVHHQLATYTYEEFQV